jgi:hypothetical protein
VTSQNESLLFELNVGYLQALLYWDRNRI